VSRTNKPLVKIKGEWALAPERLPRIPEPTNPDAKCDIHVMSEWMWDPISGKTVQRCLACGENGRVLR